MFGIQILVIVGVIVIVFLATLMAFHIFFILLLEVFYLYSTVYILSLINFLIPCDACEKQ